MMLRGQFPLPQYLDREAPKHTMGVPRITPVRYFSAATGDEKKKPSMQERQQQAKAAATKGAKSAKDLLRTYGPVFVGTYLSVYAATLSSLFVGVESGALDPGFVLSMVTDDTQAAKSTVQVIVEVLDHYPWTRPYAPIIERNPEFANLGVAWVATKFTEPIRLAITIPLVPKIARTIGWTTPKEEKIVVDDKEIEVKEDLPCEKRE
jgi:hypothetical protein